MVELQVGSRLILNDKDYKVNVFEVTAIVGGSENMGEKWFSLKQVKGRM